MTMLKIVLTATIALTAATPALSHGGGCRKDSPPGQCCHMDRKAGTAHCH